MIRPLLAGFAVLAFTCGGCERSSSYPSRPIVMICPWAAGGGTDRLCRHTAYLLERELGVPVNVVNATGGGGVTGHTRGALAPADGYTLTMITVELNILPHRGMTSIDHTDYQPLMLLNRDAAAVFVRSDAPWQSLSELADSTRERPGDLKASGTARGGIWHLALAGWLAEAGMAPDAIRWVSIGGSAPSLQELLAGGVDVVSCSLPEAQTLLESGRIRCLGVMADERLDGYLAVPTFREQGFDWSMGTWRGVAMPTGGDPAVIERLVGALHNLAQSDDFISFMASAGFGRATEGPASFGRSLASSDTAFARLLSRDRFMDAAESRFGPMAFPMIIAASLAITGLLTLRSRRSQSGARGATISWSGLPRAAAVVAAIVVFALAVDTVGYMVVAAALVAGLMLMLGERWPRSVAAALLLAAASFAVFSWVLRVPLPHGWLGF